MRKFIVICFLILNLNFINTNAISSSIFNVSKDEIIYKTLNELIRIGNENLTFKSYESIYSINGDKNIALITFNEGGFTFVNETNNQIIVYIPTISETPYEGVDSSYKKIFGGPYAYFVETVDNKIINLETSKVVDNNDIDFDINEKVNSNIIKTLIKESQKSTISPLAYVGMTESRFSRYNSSSWINYDGTCGTYATAIMLAYLDDYINDKYIPSAIRSRNSALPGSLISTLKPLIDGRTNYTGTYPDDLYMGTLQFFSDNGISVVHDFGGSTFSTAKTVINSGRPIAIGLLTILGSSYGDHWVTAYQYEDGSLLNDYYKVVDNHGNYIAIISVGWTNGFYKITG